MMAWRTMRPGTSDAIDRSTADPSPPSPPSLSRCTAKKLAPTNIKNTLWGNPRNPPKSMCHASRSQCRLSRGGRFYARIFKLNTWLPVAASAAPPSTRGK